MALRLTDSEIAALRHEKHKRRLKADFAYFADCALKRRNPDFALSAGHLLLCNKLQLVADGQIKKLMAFCPCRWGKSTILSQMFPAWLFARQRSVQLIGASHNGEFAENKISRPIQDLMKDFQVDLGVIPIDDNKKEWRTSNGGSYRAAGVGAGILGESATGGIIDDPFGNAEDAKSSRMRDKVYDWYKGDFLTRLYMGRSWQILMHQRLHQDDLAGRLLDEEGDTWEVLHLPARFEGLDWAGRPIACDEMGRTNIGDSIWPEEWTDELLTEREQAVGPYAWASMYMQRPTPVGGSTFIPARLNIIETEAELPKRSRMVLTFDYAAARTKGDFTVGCLMQENAQPIGGWTILDIERGQGGPDAMLKLILDTAERHAAKYGKLAFKIFLPQDAAAAGAYMASSLVKALAGYDVEAAREGGDKELRASPLASQVNAGNVSLLAGKWNKVLKDEFESFPGGKNDDIVDACSTAFAHLIPEPVVVIEPSWGHYSGMAR